MLSGIISLDHNEKEAAHEPESERLNNSNPSSSRGPCEFQMLIIAARMKSVECFGMKYYENVVIEFRSVTRKCVERRRSCSSWFGIDP